MTAKTKRYLITNLTRETLSVTRSDRTKIRAFCPECRKEVEMKTLDALTSLTGRSTRELFRLIEQELVHSIETERGHLLICQDSLEA